MNQYESTPLVKQETGLGAGEQEQKAWNVEILEQVRDIKPSQFHPEKPWIATHFMIEKPER